MVQIETRMALSAAAEIAAVPGVTDLFLGPADLARALGEPPGMIFTEAVLDAMSTIAAAIGTSPLQLGVFVDSVERARHARSLGYSTFAIGTDALFLGHAAQARARETLQALIPTAAKTA
jgi:4-hydroxy-2-oxoheptanedioate aldolase